MPNEAHWFSHIGRAFFVSCYHANPHLKFFFAFIPLHYFLVVKKTEFWKLSNLNKCALLLPQDNTSVYSWELNLFVTRFAPLICNGHAPSFLLTEEINLLCTVALCLTLHKHCQLHNLLIAENFLQTDSVSLA